MTQSHFSHRNDHFNDINFESVKQNETQVLTVKNWTTHSEPKKDKQKISITYDRNDGVLCHKYVVSLNGLKTGEWVNELNNKKCLIAEFSLEKRC